MGSFFLHIWRDMRVIGVEDFENVKATIIRITAEKVQVVFDREVKGDRGRLFSKERLGIS
jgi:hypothetical protein